MGCLAVMPREARIGRPEKVCNMIHGKLVIEELASAPNISGAGRPWFPRAWTGFGYSQRTSLPQLSHSQSAANTVLHDVMENRLLVDAVEPEVFLVEPVTTFFSH